MFYVVLIGAPEAKHILLKLIHLMRQYPYVFPTTRLFPATASQTLLVKKDVSVEDITADDLRLPSLKYKQPIIDVWMVERYSAVP